MAFQSVKQLLERFKGLGATRVFCKRLAENDNTKQQIYLGGSFDVLSFFPFGTVREFPGLKKPNLKAALNLSWVTATAVESAPDAQLILYPKYPEVRLSGFLTGCSIAPRKHMQPIPAGSRKGIDTRVLVFGTTADRQIFTYLAPADSPLSAELIAQISTRSTKGVFLELTLATGSQRNKALLLEKLREIHLQGYHASVRLTGGGEMLPYIARNAGGATLECLLGIRPNSESAPDFLGWEIKAYGGDKLTLMTPEPNGGYYGENGVAAFVGRYGYTSSEDRLDFTGLHKIGTENNKTRLRLALNGFDVESRKIVDVGGAVALLDSKGAIAASWNIASLLEHWNRKHAFAAYVPYARRDAPPGYRYKSPVLLGEGTDFPKFLSALCSQHVVYDPGCKVEGLLSRRPKAKARSQFRIALKRLNVLYDSLESVPL